MTPLTLPLSHQAHVFSSRLIGGTVNVFFFPIVIGISPPCSDTFNFFYCSPFLPSFRDKTRQALLEQVAFFLLGNSPYNPSSLLTEGKRIFFSMFPVGRATEPTSLFFLLRHSLPLIMRGFCVFSCSPLAHLEMKSPSAARDYEASSPPPPPLSQYRLLFL